MTATTLILLWRAVLFPLASMIGTAFGKESRILQVKLNWLRLSLATLPSLRLSCEVYSRRLWRHGLSGLSLLFILLVASIIQASAGDSRPSATHGERDASILYSEAGKWEMSGDYRRAVEYLSRAIKLDPTNPVYYGERGNLYAKIGEKVKSLEDHRTQIALKPQNPYVYLVRAESGSTLGLFKDAIADYDLAIKLGGVSFSIYLGRGIAYLGAKDYRKAIESFNTALGTGRSPPELFYYRAKAKAAPGDVRGAMADLRTGAEICEKYLKHGKISDVHPDYPGILKMIKNETTKLQRDRR